MAKVKSGSENKGLTVRINLWALESYLEDFNSVKARLWIRGQVVNEHTGEKKLFNDSGELVTTLGKWNAARYRALRTAKNPG